MAEDGVKLRRVKKVAGIDDPVVVVQRILNIFRQLHILDAEQKEDFNNMILRQPPEIRHMSHVLPGGSLLQEYIDELEESRGIAPDQRIGSDNVEAPTSGNILAEALSNNKTEAVAATSAQPAASASSNEDFQKQMLLMMQAMKSSTAPAPTIGGTITADAGFAKEIAQALSQSLEASDEKHRHETQELTKKLTESQMQMTKILVSQMLKNNLHPAEKNNEVPITVHNAANDEVQTVKVIDNTQEITKAITESQLQMAKMFLQQNAINAANISSNNAANNIQINNAVAPAAGHQDLIGNIIKAQSQLFQEMSKTQTKELALLISDALKESSKLSNKSLIEALSAFQKENLKFLERQAKNQNQPVVYYPAPTGAVPPNVIPTEATLSPKAAYTPMPEENQENQAPSYIKKVLGNVFSRSKADETVIEAAQEIIPDEEDNAQDEIENAIEEVIFEDSGEDDFAITSDGLGLSENAEIKKKKKKKKKNKNKNNLLMEETNQPVGYMPLYAENKDDYAFDDNSLSETELADDDFSFEIETAPITAEEDSFGLDASLFNLDTPDITKIEDNTWDNLSAFETSEEETPLIEEYGFTEAETVVEDEQEESDAAIVEAQPTEKHHSPQSLLNNLKNLSGLSEKFGHHEEPIEAIEALDLNADDMPENTQDESWEWEYEETDDTATPIQAVTQVEALENAVEVAEDEEWAWEYEETDDTATPIQAVTQVEAMETAAEVTEDGEWEWEYEETDDTATPIEAVTQVEAIENAMGVAEDGEWEWEYEETDDTATPVEAVTQVEAIENAMGVAEDGEWEWEYEETDDTATPIEAVTSDAVENFNSKIKNMTDNDLSSLFDEFDNTTEAPIGDPYAGDENNSDDLELASLQSGSLFFQKDIVTPKNQQKMPPDNLNESEPEVVFAEFGEDNSKNEPYRLNSDIKP